MPREGSQRHPFLVRTIDRSCWNMTVKRVGADKKDKADEPAPIYWYAEGLTNKWGHAQEMIVESKQHVV